jgi:hypothetical protein
MKKYGDFNIRKSGNGCDGCYYQKNNSCSNDDFLCNLTCDEIYKLKSKEVK